MQVSRGVKIVFLALSAGILFFSAGPFLMLAERLLSDGRHFSLLWERENLKAVYDTLRVGLVSLLVAFSFSLPLGWLLSRTDLPAAGWLKRVFLFPYLLPPYLFAIAWIALALPGVGFLNRWIGANWLNVYSSTGLVWVLANAFFPLLLSSFCSALEGMDASLEEAARICGASPWRTFRKVTLPCLLPAFASASLLFLLAVMAAFGIPALIGNPARVYLLTTKVYTYAKLGGLSGMDKAFSLSLWLLVLALPFLALNGMIRRAYRSRLVVGKVTRPTRARLGRARVPLLLAVGLAASLLVGLPLSAIVLNGFLRVAGDLSFANLTTRNFEYLLEMPEFTRAWVNSLCLSIAAAAFCTAVAFLVAYFSDRTSFKGRHLVEKIASFPYAVPGAVIALALILSFGQGWGIDSLALLGSPLLLLLAYNAKYLAIAVQSVGPAMGAVDPSLDEAARLCGAGSWKVLGSILLPLLLPALGHVFLLTFLPVFTELTMSVLLYGPGLETLGTLMFQLQDYANPLAACALATLLILSLALLMLAFRGLATRFGGGT